MHKYNNLKKDYRNDKPKLLQLLFLVSSMTAQVMGMMPQEIIPKPPKRVSSLPFRVEGIAQRIEKELPKELKYKILSLALELRENQKYGVYKKLDVGPTNVRAIALNADNTGALTGSLDGIARLWDVEKGRVLKELKGHTADVISVALSADGTFALTSSYDETVRIWDILREKSIILQVGSRVNSVGLNADGTLALTGSYDGTARVWNTNTGELLKTLQVGSWVSSVALSADGTLALTGSYNNKKVLVWDARSGDLLNTLLPTGPNSLIALSKDGKRALTSTHDKKIQVWNTRPLSGQKETNTPLTVLEGHPMSVKLLAFGSADFIASVSLCNTAFIWKSFALEPRGPQENVAVLRQAYKETFSRPKFLFPDEK